MTPEQKAREMIDKKLEQSGWVVQDMKQLNLFAGLGVAVREFPTSTALLTMLCSLMELPSASLKPRKMMPVRISPP